MKNSIHNLFSNFLFIFFIFIIMILSISCGNESSDNNDDHIHKYVGSVVSATCEEEGYTKNTCSICGNVEKKDIVKPLGHYFNSYVSNNDATCLSNGTKTAKCIGCDKLDTIEDKNSKLQHNYIENKTKPTCLEDGYSTFICEHCNDTYKGNVVNKLGHNFSNYVSNGDATCLADGTKTAKCSRCEITDTKLDEGSKLGHNFTSYVPNKDATCLVDGTKTGKCTRCEATDTKANVGSKLGHNFANYVSNGDATCLVDGTKTGKCSRCEITDTKVDAGSKLGHNFVNYISNNDATYEKDGTKTAKCERCEVTNTITDIGSKLDHDYKITIVNPTCLDDGYTLHECKSCEFSFKDTYVTKLGHNFVNYVSNGDALCLADGTKTAKCTRCEATDTKADEGSKLGHNFVTYISNKDALCLTDGTKTSKCTRCTVTDTKTDTGSRLGHSYGAYVSNNDAECEKDGTKTARCIRCSVKATITDTGSKLGHSIGNFETIKSPTCLDSGYRVKKCIRCQTEFERENLAALNHTFVNYISNNNATYESNATAKAKCVRCNETDTIVLEGSKLKYDYVSDGKVIMSCANPYVSVGNTTKDTTVTFGNHTYSYKWTNQDTKTSVRFAFTGDITSYDRLILTMYSEKKTFSTMQLCINCQKNSTGTTGYKRYNVVVDFVGWKTFEIDINSLAGNYDPDYTKVSNITFNASGWSQTPNPETVVYIDSMILANSIRIDEPVGGVNNSEYQNVKDNLVAMMNGGVALNNADSVQKTKLNSLINSAKNAQKNMRKGNMTPFNADMNYTAGITTNYNNIKNMAIGYSIKGSDIYHDAKLKEDILYALEYMHENYYKDKNLHTYPSRNNWWDWEIGSAQAIVNILMLMEDTISEELIDKYLEPVNKYVPYPTMTMANRVDLAYVTIAAGALQKDYVKIVKSRNLLNECLLYVETGDGFYRDGSVVQHDVIPYAGGYGPIMLEALSKLVIATDGTCFEFSEEVKITQYKWAMESFVPLMYRGATMGLFRGRNIVRSTTDLSTGFPVIQGMLRLTQYVSDNTFVNNLKSVLKEFYNYNKSYYNSSLTPFDYAIIKEIDNDANVKARTNSNFANVYGMMDRAVAQYGNYAVGISMSSARIAKYEALNDENLKGWYTGEGMLYIYTSIDDYSPNYWKYVNMYKLPGTTISSANRTSANITAKNTLTDCTFVGGSSLDLNMVVAMNFKADASKIGFTSDLTGNKGYFVFDKEIVCLGNGISYSGNDIVETIIENRMFASGKVFKANGTNVSTSSGTLSSVKTMFMEGYGGIYLPNASAIKYNRTSGTVQFIELSINHGNKFTNETYEYVLLPLFTDKDTEEYSKNPDIEILINNVNVSAVKNKRTNITEYIFWKKGTYSIDGNTITVDNPCTVIISEKEIALTDPTHKIENIKLTLNGKDYNFNGIYEGRTFTLSK